MAGTGLVPKLTAIKALNNRDRRMLGGFHGHSIIRRDSVPHTKGAPWKSMIPSWNRPGVAASFALRMQSEPAPSGSCV